MVLKISKNFIHIRESSVQYVVLFIGEGVSFRESVDINEKEIEVDCLFLYFANYVCVIQFKHN